MTGRSYPPTSNAGVGGEVLGRTMAQTSNPSPHCLVGDIQPTRSGQRISDVAMAEREAHLEPNGVPE